MLDATTAIVNGASLSLTSIGRYSHSAVYQCVKSKPWKIWEEHDETAMGQKAFTEFLEDRAGDIVTPTSAELLEIATKFPVVCKAVFGSAIRLATGEFQFNYSDENDKGTIEVPEVITLGLALFHSGKSYEVQARCATACAKLSWPSPSSSLT